MSRYTRRKLMQAGFGLVLATALPLINCSGDSPSDVPADTPVPAPEPPPFPQPPELRSSAGLLETTLDVRLANHDLNGQAFSHRSYNGLIGGPTLRVRPGDMLRVRVNNNLPPDDESMVMPVDVNVPHGFNVTNLHTHGLHVSPQGSSDNVFVEIEPGQSFEYEYQIPADHPEGTYWYHPHKHGSTAVQLFSGMAGAIIIEGGLDQVPEIAVARDIILLINELNVDPTGFVPDFMTNGSFPLTQRYLTVNGELLPRLTINPGEVVRLRVINATVRTEIPFFVDGHELTVVSRDGIAFATATTEQVSLAAANRSDILIRGGAPGVYSVRKGVGTSGMNPDPEVVLMTLEVAGTPVTMDMPSALPAPFVPISDDELTGSRELVFNVGPNGPPGGFPNFTIDGNRYDPDRIDQLVQLNAVEEWTLTNLSNVGHPFHIHVNDFQVMSVNGVAPPAPLWLDTVDIPANGNVVIRQRFTDFTGEFVLHCHILVHEDLGMMQNVSVVLP